jgi:GcrA cell cycle regulator
MIGFQMAIDNWTAEEKSILIEHWDSNKSAQEISNMLGTKSRNAVIGKAHRLGLASRKKASPPRNPTKVPKVANDNTEPKMAKIRTIKAKPPTKLSAEVPLPTGQHPITIMELTSNTCRAIVGRGSNGLATYCGEEVFPGKVWCPGHCVLYFNHEPRRRSA